MGVAPPPRKPILGMQLRLGVLLFLGVCAPALAARTTKVSALTLVYDRTPAVCHYLLNLYNHDLARKGYVDTRAHRVFRAIHWVRLRGLVAWDGHIGPANLFSKVAFFDITNNGHPKPVVRSLSYVGLSATGSEHLYIVRTAPKDAQQWFAWLQHPQGQIEAVFPPLPDMAPPVSISSLYFLKHRPPTGPPVWRGQQYPFVNAAFSGLHPLRYRGTTYLNLSFYAAHGQIKVGGPFGHWIVIGTFRPDDTFHDVCYFRVTRPWAQRR